MRNEKDSFCKARNAQHMTRPGRHWTADGRAGIPTGRTPEPTSTPVPTRGHSTPQPRRAETRQAGGRTAARPRGSCSRGSRSWEEGAAQRGAPGPRVGEGVALSLLGGKPRGGWELSGVHTTGRRRPLTAGPPHAAETGGPHRVGDALAPRTQTASPGPTDPAPDSLRDDTQLFYAPSS